MELGIHFRRFFLLLLGTGFLFSSCKKAEDRRCLKSTGKEITKEVALMPFKKLYIGRHIECELVQDSTNRIEITGGENLVNFLELSYDTDQQQLSLNNTNKCNFLRNLKKNRLKAVVHFTDIVNIHFEGTDDLKGNLKTPYFTLLIRDGSGTVHLNLDCEDVQADISHGWGDYIFSGKTKYASIAVRSNGYCDVNNLKITDSVYTSNNSSGDIYLNADHIPMSGEIKGFGNIYYKGIPASVDMKITGKGSLINNN